ncbi:hypothetical protein O3656_04620 [Pauljensenia sp. 27098_8_83]
MAGNADVSYDDDQQQAAAPKVTETWDAVTGSRKHTEALGSAQTSTFWGYEDGPADLQRSAEKMFEAVSGLLAGESTMLKNFEEDMHKAMTRFTGTEYDNQLEFKNTQADQQMQAIRSQNPTKFTAMLHALGLTPEDLGSALDPLIAPPTQSGAGSAGGSSGAPTTSSGPSDY